MSILYTFADKDFSASASKVIPPVATGAEFLSLARDTVAKAAANLIFGKADATVVGSPTAGSGFVSCKGLANYLQTSVAEVSDMSLMIVARSSDTQAAAATRPMFVGTYNGVASVDGTTSSNGSGIYVSSTIPAGSTGSPVSLIANSQRYAGGTAYSTQNAAASSITADVSVFRLYSSRFDTTHRTFKDLTGGTSSDAAINFPRLPTTNLLRVGSGFASFAGLCDVAAVAIYSRRITDAEEAAMAAWLRTMVTKYGIVV